ncbi:hypothetical protein BASA81_009142 [Batrachochytrium salamandrivorans]|nr:hypothetical protein BASA81_009142 [Batrachochytrium salamandrivorans]
MHLLEESSSSDGDSSGSQTWIEWFCSDNGNTFMCEVDRRFIDDNFNLYGLRETVAHFKTCLDIIMDRADIEDFNPNLNLRKAVSDLYGLIHSRFILTKRGQDKMYMKYKDCEFGVCPLLTCEAQPVLPVGLKDDIGEQNVLVYCPRCRNIMVPALMASSRGEMETELDGAYFGSTFPHLFFMQHPNLLPKPPLTIEPYVPRVFGFQVKFPTEAERLAAVQEYEAREDEAAEQAPARQHMFLNAPGNA